jgi:5-methylcytosine-specific restriction endonuclease McrA
LLQSTQDSAVVHGKPSTYSHQKCRCDLCKAAMREYQVAYRAKNAEKIRENGKAYYEANREDRIQQTQARYKADPEGARSDARERYRRNAELRIASALKWAQDNPDKRQAARSKRKALKRSAGVFTFTGRDWSRLCMKHSNKCAYCFSSAPLTQDHVVPIIRGGTHSVGNILPACMSCNASKGAKLLMEWKALGMNRRTEHAI